MIIPGNIEIVLLQAGMFPFGNFRENPGVYRQQSWLDHYFHYQPVFT